MGKKFFHKKKKEEINSIITANDNAGEKPHEMKNMKEQVIQTNKKSQNAVRVISFSGMDGATKNMTVYECGNDIIVVDVGVGFPEEDMPGVDVVIPDFRYLIENQERIRGIFITHGHEDHFGAVPYLLREINAPIYANVIVQEFIKERIKDRGTKEMAQKVQFHLLSAETPEVTLGNFKVSAFKVNHSVPTSLGLSINTPQGRILHMADYKIDFSPVIDEPIDIATISRYGDEGVLCLLSDCLGADHEGHSKSEYSMRDIFNELFQKGEGKQIIVTTISSNISRMHQIISAAIKAGRKTVLAGRSIQSSVRIARSLKMLPFDDDAFVEERNANQFLQQDLVYIAAGCFGQEGSALDRVSRGEHSNINLEENAMVVFSADPSPPSTRIPVEKLMDRLTLKGADVIYSRIQENLHVSGHGPKGDLKTIAALAKAKYFIPIGGNVTQSRAYRNMVMELGHEKESVFELLEGESVIFDTHGATKGSRVSTEQIMIDAGTGKGIGEIVVKDRTVLSSDGVFVVIVPVSKDSKAVLGGVEVITRGFIYVKESRQLMGLAKDKVNKLIEKSAGDMSWNNLQNKIEKELEKLLLKETGRLPMLIVHAIQI